MSFFRNGMGKRPEQIEKEKKNQLRKDLHDLKEQLIFNPLKFKLWQLQQQM